MRRGLALGLLVGWLLGIGTGLLGVAVTGGWYEYRLVEADQANRLVNVSGWELVPGFPPQTLYLRRPRFRLP